ncbi:polysaccharide pyruvyl transferase family protein [Sphingomonas sp. IC-11]|uniref:polysaccharide pyruvyl transferase family protein n=1 Tax=Sphingomonas sp. IC-11 TaxID=2898528 RepID=UPI001E550C10|nr:polysaccharide pyruvyl transferase family protein [Sphingomonas sp. IC-11]MCD2315099.1 polysaccharide pyruvyl transferase family protein [Sphingomonas sp. IC-11]
MHGRAAVGENRQESARKGQPITIGLLWHSLNSGNLGVGALTVANLTIARQVAEEIGLEPRFVVMGARDRQQPVIPLPGTRPVPIDWRALRPGGTIWRAMAEVDCVLDIGAGDSFADIYGPRRFSFLVISKLLALARHKPLIFSPQTIGPFTRRPYMAVAAFVMGRSRALFVRDELSRDVARRMAPSAAVTLAVDVAFELPFEDRSHLRGGPLLRIGVNPSGLLFDEAERGSNRFGLSYDYARFTRGLLTRLCLREDIEVHLVPHATSNRDPRDDDGALCDRLAAEFPGVVRVPNFATPSDAKSYISGLDLLVGARMHACIAAFSAGVPVVPVAYSRKFGGLFGLLDYETMVPVTGMNEEQATNLILQALANRAALADQEAAGMRRVQSLLAGYRDTLRSTFLAVSASA